MINVFIDRLLLEHAENMRILMINLSTFGLKCMHSALMIPSINPSHSDNGKCIDQQNEKDRLDA